MSRHVRLSARGELGVGVRRAIADLDAVSLSESTATSWINVTRTGSFTDPRYGRFDITGDMLLSMVKNFDARTYGQDIFIDVAHEPDKGAAAKVLQLKVDQGRLMALVEWTHYGLEAVRDRGFRYLSAEFTENYQDNEQGRQHGPLLMGAGLTTRPVIKRLDPVQLSAGTEDTTIFIHADVAAALLSEANTMWEELLKKLQQDLKAQGLKDETIRALCEAFVAGAAKLSEKPAAEKLLSEFVSAGKTLAEAAPGSNVTITLSGGGLNTDDVKKLLADEQAARDAAARKLAETGAARRTLLSDTINAAEGLTDELKKELAETVQDLVTPEMTEDQVKALAQTQITMGKRLAAARQLSAMGWAPNGSPRIEIPDEGAKKLSGIWRDQLKRTDLHAQGQLRLPEKVSAFVDKVLSEFDRLNGARIDGEVKLLSGGQTGMADTSLPVGFQREVIREALSDLNVLQLVQQLTDFSATVTTQIPYEVRDASAVYNDGIVYEGQAIHRASISQAMDTAYITPMKLAFLITNEVMHFSRLAGINWDAMARNIESNARIMRELICRRICNELQRAADAYMAVAVVAESFTAQLNGTTHTIKTANFPIVRPYQARDLQGNAVGAAENPIAITLNSAVILPWDGTGTQTAGTYYRVLSYNLGYVQFVNQAGVPVTPANTGTNTIGYAKATNVVKVDLDVPGGSTLEHQLNKLIQGVGARKAMLSGQRFVQPDFLLMSPTLNDMATNAEQFTLQGKRDGSSTTAAGDLQAIKNVPAFGTNAPGIDLGDERILMGQRGLLGYSVSKPFMTGEPFEVVDANGKPVGKKQAYGEEYSAIKVPTPLRNRMTSVLAYSFTNR